jgi:hypothetical protein
MSKWCIRQETVHSLGFDKLSLRHPYPERVEGRTLSVSKGVP